MMALFIFVLIFAVLYFNKNSNNPAKQLFKALCIGFVTFVITMLLNFGLNLLADSYPFNDIGVVFLSIFKELLVAIVLIGCFLVGFLKFIYRNKYFEQLFDAIVYMLVILVGYLLFYNFSIFILMPFDLMYVAVVLITNTALIVPVLIMSCYLTCYCFSTKPEVDDKPLIRAVVMAIFIKAFSNIYLNNQSFMYGVHGLLFYIIGLILLIVLVGLTIFAIKKLFEVDKLNDCFTNEKQAPKGKNLIDKKEYKKLVHDTKCEKNAIRKLTKGMVATFIVFLLVLGFFLLKVRLDPSSTHLMIGTARIPKINIIDKDIPVLVYDRQHGNPDYTVKYVYQYQDGKDLVYQYLKMLVDDYNFYFIYRGDYDFRLVREFGLNGYAIVKINVGDEIITTKYLRTAGNGLLRDTGEVGEAR